MDETGESSKISFPITDDGSISSKQRLELLIRMYHQHLEDYKLHLEAEYSDEKDSSKKAMLIEQEFGIYQVMLWNEFFPQLTALEKKIADEEEKAKIDAKREKKFEKRKADEEEKAKKAEEEKAKKAEEERQLDEERRLEEERQEQARLEQERQAQATLEREQAEEAQKTNNPDGEAKPKTKSQALIEQFDGELKNQGINFDEFKDKENLDFGDLNPNEENRLSMLVFEGLKYSINKSDTNHNPGWLLLYLNAIHPTLAKLLSPNTLMNCSNMIMGYLRPRYSLDSQDAPQLFEDLKHSDKFKHLPIHKKILLYELKVANDMSNGYISKDNSSHNILLYLLDEVPFSAIENKPDRFTKKAEEEFLKEELITEEVTEIDTGFFNEDTPYEFTASDDDRGIIPDAIDLPDSTDLPNDTNLSESKSNSDPFYIDCTVSEEFDNAMHFIDPTYKKEEEVREPSNLYYVYDENIPLVPREKADETDDFETASKVSTTPFVTYIEPVISSFDTEYETDITSSNKAEDTTMYPVSNTTYIGVVSNSEVTRFEQFVIHVKEHEELANTSFEERIDSFKKSEYSGDDTSSTVRTIIDTPQEVVQVNPNPIIKTNDNYDTKSQE